MRSSTVLDRSVPAADPPVARELLVLWQHPETREIVPIGRFSHDGETYCFVYTRAAATVPNFRPLPGLDDLRRRYVTRRFPAVFRQRIMDPERPDYPEYLNSLGLDPSHATPWEQIVHSGARGRATPCSSCRSQPWPTAAHGPGSSQTACGTSPTQLAQSPGTKSGLPAISMRPPCAACELATKSKLSEKTAIPETSELRS